MICICIIIWIKYYSLNLYYNTKREFKSFCWNSCFHFILFKWKSRRLVCMCECSFIKVYVCWVPLGHWRCGNVIPSLYYIISCTHILKLNTVNMWELKLWMVTYTQLNMYALNIQNNFNHSWTANLILCRFILNLFYFSLNEMKTKILTQSKCHHVTWMFDL